LNSKNEKLLIDAIEKASDIIEHAKSLGLVGIPGFGLGASILLSLLHDAWRQNKTEGNKKNLQDFAAAFVSYVPELRQMLVQYNLSRFSELIYSPVINMVPFPSRGHEPVGPTRQIPAKYSYTMDGQIMYENVATQKDLVVRDRSTRMQSEFTRLEKEIIAPLYPLAVGWAKIAAGNISPTVRIIERFPIPGLEDPMPTPR
jgi:hypothetical protein